jgi:type IV pilus assembly protein PilC
MVAVGEETGDLDKMLIRVADNYDEQVEVLVGSLMSMLEPIMILVLGGIVMTIVLAVFLPMIQVITSLSAA